MDDPWFRNEVYCRWDELSAPLLNNNQIFQMMDSSMLVMDQSIDFNFDRWPVLGEYVWPNYFIADTYEEEIDFVQNWISERLIWMDNQWGGKCFITSNEQSLIEAAQSVLISPNPSDLSHSRIQFADPLSGEYHLTLFDMNGRQVYQHTYPAMPGSRDIDLENLSYLNSGIYLLRISSGEGFIEFLKLIKE